MNFEGLSRLRGAQQGVVTHFLSTITNTTTTTQLAVIIKNVEDRRQKILSLSEEIALLPEVTEEEVIKAAMYDLELQTRISELEDSIQKASTPPTFSSPIGPARPSSQPTGSHSSPPPPPPFNLEDTTFDPFEVTPTAASATPLRQESPATSGQQHSSILDGSSSSSYSVRLPKLDLPTFNGVLTEWQSFWDSFSSAVHLNERAPAIEKFARLNSLLKDEAKSCISGFAITSANYQKAIELLHERYGQTNRITQAHMKALYDLPTPARDFVSLQSFYDELESHIRGLESLGQRQEQYGALLAPLIIEKLPSDVRQSMARANGGADWDLPALRSVFRKELEIRRCGLSIPSSIPASSYTASTHVQANKRQSRPTAKASITKKSDARCPFCDGPHLCFKCDVVTDITRRNQIVLEKKLCSNCLSGNHLVAKCTSRYTCRKCRKRHNTSICTAVQASTHTTHIAGTVEEEPQPAQPDVQTYAVPADASGSLLCTAISPVKIGPQTAEANILFDLGAQRTFVSEEFTKRLNAKPTDYEDVVLSGIEDIEGRRRRLPRLKLQLQTLDGEYIDIQALVLKNIAAPIRPRNINVLKQLTYLKTLRLAHPMDAQGEFNVDLLIAADAYWDIVQSEIVTGDGPTAINSKVGYLLSGPVKRRNNPVNIHIGVLQLQEPVSRLNVKTPVQQQEQSLLNNQSLMDDLNRFWELESIGISPPKNTDDSEEAYRDFYRSNMIKLVDGKCQAQLPWKSEFPDLPTNYDISSAITRNMIRRMDTQMIMMYDDILKDQERQGFIERVDPYQPTNNRVHYIPHRWVIKDSPTTPLRVVYNCSCKKSKSHSSLNDCLRSIPPVYNDITEILLKFRMKEHAVISDIEKAFLNVSLFPGDRDVTRFFWLSDSQNTDSPWNVYRFRSVLFGSSASPFILDSCIRKLLENSSENTARVMLSGLYVDNIVNSFQSQTEMEDYYTKSRALMNSIGFNLRSWRSTDAKINNLAIRDNVYDSTPEPKVLGLIWNVNKDTLSFPNFDAPVPDKPTKREVISCIAKVYDPLGMLSPVTVKAKIFMQKLWKVDSLQWDQQISDDLATEWTSIRNDIQEARKFKFPRRIQTNTPAVLHVFVDSSCQAYGAAAYLVSNDVSTLIFAKSKVAPIKTLTLPRLELMAAVIGARLLSFLTDIFRPTEVFFWSDSQIVISWLASSKKLEVFTRNRVTEINQLIGSTPVLYCPTDSNPSDLLTRGIPASKFLQCQLWQQGPAWLTNPSNWPSPKPMTLTQLVCAADAYIATSFEPPVSAQVEQSSWITNLASEINDPYHLMRAFANARRFLNKTRRIPVSDAITSEELKDAELLIIRQVQSDIYRKEREAIIARKPNALVKQLRLFIDNDGIIRCRGRIHNADLPEDTKFPILLPPKHPFTRSIIRQIHRDQKHLGLQATLSALRQRFWIPQGGQETKTVLRSCVPCKKHHGRPYATPVDPPLPKMRLLHAPPFTVTGIDFSGAFPVRSSHGLTQVYILLFTCATTRAVHLEALTNMTTSSLLLALRRFMSRRGTPSNIVSDNATYFQAADIRLQAITKSAEFQKHMSNRRIEWTFIPKRSPWFGGFYERVIGLTKSCVKTCIGKNPVTLEVFTTLLTEVEAILNNRPLTKASTDINDLTPLTPADLLHGRRLPQIPLDTYDDDDPTFGADDLHAFQADLTRRLDSAWKRFHAEYLTALRQYHVSTGTVAKQTISKGDVVLVHHEGPRHAWKLAVVENLHYGNDGIVRSADIRTATGRTNRPIQKLYPIEVRSAEQTDAGTDAITHHVPQAELRRPTRQAARTARLRIQQQLASDSEDE